MINFISFVDCIDFVYSLGTQGALSTRSSTCWVRHRFRMNVEGVSVSGDAPGREMFFFFYQRVTEAVTDQCMFALIWKITPLLPESNLPGLVA